MLKLRELMRLLMRRDSEGGIEPRSVFQGTVEALQIGRAPGKWAEEAKLETARDRKRARALPAMAALLFLTAPAAAFDPIAVYVGQTVNASFEEKRVMVVRSAYRMVTGSDDGFNEALVGPSTSDRFSLDPMIGSSIQLRRLAAECLGNKRFAEAVLDAHYVTGVF